MGMFTSKTNDYFLSFCEANTTMRRRRELPSNSELEKLRVELEEELEKKAERRDRNRRAAEMAKNAGFPDTHKKLSALADDEGSHSAVLREILSELH